MGEFPSLLIFPPLVNAVDVMLVTVVVLMIGIAFGGSFLQLIISTKRRHIVHTEKI